VVVALLLLIAAGDEVTTRCISTVWPGEVVVVLLPLVVAGSKATHCTSTAWPSAVSPWTRVEEALASIAVKREVTLLPHAYE
jgi:hypothetical protein